MFAVFIEPNERLKENIWLWKELIQRSFPDQPYTRHPPHCTLICTDVLDEYQAQLRVSNALQDMNRFSIETEGTHAFWSDSATDGGHTICWRLKSFSPLFRLQELVAEAIRPNLAKYTPPDIWGNNAEIKNSLKQYHFPFIGHHWIPHMTIASLHVMKDHELIQKFMKQEEKFTNLVDEISFWKVNGEKHQKLSSKRLT